MALNEPGRDRVHRCIAATLACALLGVSGCASKVVMVKAAKADVQPITRTVSTNGKVELTQDFQAHALVGGQVKQVLVKVGDAVTQGQMLVRLDDTDARLRVGNANYAIQSAQNAVTIVQQGGNPDDLLGEKADMTAAQVTLRQANLRLTNLQRLQTTGAASANEVSAAQSQVTEAQNRVNALQARRVGRFSAGDLQQQRDQLTAARDQLAAAESDLGTLDIRAPFAGTVYAVPALPYATVSAGEDLVNMADLNRIRVRAFFDEPEIGRLAVGQPVRITWEAKPDRTWHGHIEALPTSITNVGTRNVGQCLISVDDAHGELIPNVNVTVYVTTLHRDAVLAIPRESLRTDGARNFVYRIVGGKLKRTPVQIDVLSHTLVEITGGLQQGDSVVLVPLNDVELRDGAPVKVQP